MLFTSLSLATALFLVTTPFTTPSVIVERTKPFKEELSTSQVEWLAKLETQESSGSTTVRILDTNKKFSTGCLQFQDETFLIQGKKYKLIPESLEKAEPLIYNCELQYKIAHKMLLDGGEGHWFNSVKKLQLGKYPK